ncbi:hypothetical protein [Ammoniphilus sp. CFH 90114]|uniref:hypothetical protein n=1 Tax=Ammoniphilus sp. CFH 90114 TaxID=2493665 RepID=UPI00100E098D|nr:hypothetical protein [Ammoniphilus sp. CFH 90114]RXT03832.1 hypothetical protein EIZ39_22920 [Ammoniphilus sp. CFH 90114]
MNTSNHESLEKAAESILTLISKFIGVNTFLVATNDTETSYIMKAFNREKPLIEEGASLPFAEAY